MDDATLLNWSVQQSRWMRLFKSLMALCALMLMALVVWPLVQDRVISSGLVAGILMLAGIRFFQSLRNPDIVRHDSVRSLSRLATSHWRIATGNQSVDGCLQHVWYGWGWMTLRFQPYAQARPVTLTIWRANVSAAAWHRLRVWAAWELAMVKSPAPEVQP